MKKRTKRIIIGFALVAVLICAALAGLLVKLHQETGSMSPLATGEIIPGVYAVKDGYVNFFLLKGTDGFIAIDAGNSVDGAREEMQKLAVDPSKVSAVFLTHSDQDHVAALGLFANAVICLSKDEEQMINGKTPRFVVIHNKKIPRYKLLGDDQVIEVSGLKVTAIAAPGHTPGSICYIVNDTSLFTGDTMSLKNGRADIFNEFFNMDTKTERDSIRKLAAPQGLKYVFTAHHGYSEAGKAFANHD